MVAYCGCILYTVVRIVCTHTHFTHRLVGLLLRLVTHRLRLHGCPVAYARLLPFTYVYTVGYGLVRFWFPYRWLLRGYHIYVYVTYGLRFLPFLRAYFVTTVPVLPATVIRTVTLRLPRYRAYPVHITFYAFTGYHTVGWFTYVVLPTADSCRVTFACTPVAVYTHCLRSFTAVLPTPHTVAVLWVYAVWLRFTRYAVHIALRAVLPRFAVYPLPPAAVLILFPAFTVLLQFGYYYGSYGWMPLPTVRRLRFTTGGYRLPARFYVCRLRFCVLVGWIAFYLFVLYGYGLRCGLRLRTGYRTLHTVTYTPRTFCRFTVTTVTRLFGCHTHAFCHRIPHVYTAVYFATGSTFTSVTVHVYVTRAALLHTRLPYRLHVVTTLPLRSAVCLRTFAVTRLPFVTHGWLWLHWFTHTVYRHGCCLPRRRDTFTVLVALHTRVTNGWFTYITGSGYTHLTPYRFCTHVWFCRILVHTFGLPLQFHATHGYCGYRLHTRYTRLVG